MWRAQATPLSLHTVLMNILWSTESRTPPTRGDGMVRSSWVGAWRNVLPPAMGNIRSKWICGGEVPCTTYACSTSVYYYSVYKLAATPLDNSEEDSGMEVSSVEDSSMEDSGMEVYSGEG